MAAKKAIMPPDCCGACAFAIDVKGEPYLLCLSAPPSPVIGDDSTVTWERGAPVEAADPRCFFFAPKSSN